LITKNLHLVKVVGNIFPKEPCDKVTEYDGLVRFIVVWRGRDPCQVPQIAFPFVELVKLAASVEQNDVGCAFDEPSTIEDFDPTFAE